MSSIPFDVIGEILIRLPVKDLLRFRCVSEFFGSLIDSSDFAKRNLSHSQKTNTNLYGTFETVKFEHIMLFDLSRSVKNVSDDYLDDVFVETVNRPPSRRQTLLREVVGSCNGLVALSCRGTYFGYSQNVILWNPLTAKYKKITSRSPVPPNSRISYGLGYDPKTDDYKLVRIATSRKYEHKSAFRADIYSLKTNSWNFMDKPWYLNCWQKEGGVLLNNVLHWGVLDQEYNYGGNKIVAFDLVKESFHFLPVPKRVNCFYFTLKLSVFNGCLTLCNGNYSGIYVWILKEHGVEKSWTKLLHFDLSSMIRKKLRSSSSITPLAYSRDGDKLLLSQSHKACDLHWYDLSTKEWFKPRLYRRNTFKRRGDVKTFVGSLVSPDESKDWVNLKRKRQSIDMKKETKRRITEE